MFHIVQLYYISYMQKDAHTLILISIN